MPQHSLSRMEAQLAAAPPPNLPDDICAEILVRLPAKSVLRFRAVCKAWRERDITTRPLFHAAHARLQPSKVLLYTHLDSEQPGHAVDVALDVVPVSGEEQQRLIRYPRAVSTIDPPILDSCDGVLLFRTDAAPGTYVLCNPLTRQWAEITHGQRYGCVREYALYFHQQSGEYRLLCRHVVTSAGGWAWAWCVLSTGAAAAADPRRVDADITHAADDDDHDDLLGLDTQKETRPVAFHGSMHWPPRRPRNYLPSTTTTEMVAFDVHSEKFHLVAGPRTDTRRSATTMMKLFVMDGVLVAANFRAEEDAVELWFLVDYGAAGRWERRHQVATPWRPKQQPWPGSLWSMAAACDDRGNVMLGDHTGLLVYNVRTKTVRAVSSVATPRNNVVVSRHVFRESLVEHPNFKRSSSADLPFITSGANISYSTLLLLFRC